MIVKPALAIAAIITEALGVFCETSQSFAFANVYIEIVDFVCITIALYGLVSPISKFQLYSRETNPEICFSRSSYIH